MRDDVVQDAGCSLVEVVARPLTLVKVVAAIHG
jgi:hypothetical protein